MATRRSKLEDEVEKELKTTGHEYAYESDYLHYVQPETKRSYNPDFTLDNGIFIEVKGKLDVPTRKKMKLVKEHNPDADIRFVFDRNNKLSKAKKSWRYEDWCRINGFQCCFIRPGRTADQKESWQNILVRWANE